MPTARQSGGLNNKVVDIPGLTGRWNDGLADGVKRDTRKASGRKQFTDLGLFIEAKAVLENGAASGAPRCERANHKTSIWSQNATKLLQIVSRIGPEVDRIERERFVERIRIDRDVRARALRNRHPTLTYCRGIKLCGIRDHRVRNVEPEIGETSRQRQNVRDFPSVAKADFDDPVTWVHSKFLERR